MENIYHDNTNTNKVEMAMLILNNIDFRRNSITRNKEVHFMMINRSICQKDIIILNIYVPNKSTGIEN